MLLLGALHGIRKNFMVKVNQSEKLKASDCLWMAVYTRIGKSVAQVSMSQGSYKLSMLERDLPVHVANFERWVVEGWMVQVSVQSRGKRQSDGYGSSGRKLPQPWGVERGRRSHTSGLACNLPLEGCRQDNLLLLLQCTGFLDPSSIIIVFRVSVSNTGTFQQSFAWGLAMESSTFIAWIIGQWESPNLGV